MTSPPATNRSTFINRPFLFTFDRIQAIGDEMVGWSDAGLFSSNGKKCRFETGPPQSKCSKYRVAVADKMIDEDQIATLS